MQKQKVAYFSPIFIFWGKCLASGECSVDLHQLGQAGGVMGMGIATNYGKFCNDLSQTPNFLRAFGLHVRVYRCPCQNGNFSIQIKRSPF